MALVRRNCHAFDSADRLGLIEAADFDEPTGAFSWNHYHASRLRLALGQFKIFLKRMPDDQLLQRHSCAESQHARAKTADRTGMTSITDGPSFARRNSAWIGPSVSPSARTAFAAH